jgi:hypothetical protein
VSTVFVAIVGIAVVVLRDVIRDRSERNRFARIEAALARALHASPDSPTGSPYRDAPAIVADVFGARVVPVEKSNDQCTSTRYGSRCLGIGDPCCVAGNCTEHCNEHCHGSCRDNVRLRGS